MGTGRELGRQLNAALRDGSLPSDSGRALANRLGDWLGADRTLEGPLRDLVSRPQFRQALATHGPVRRRALRALAEDLAHTYTPGVLAEMAALLEAAFEETDLRPIPADPASEPVAAQASSPGRPRPPVGRALRRWGLPLGDELRAIGPGMALAAAAAAVLSWLAGALATSLPGPWTGSPGVFLLCWIVLVQLVTVRGLRNWRRRLALEAGHCSEPRRAWNWASAPWIHRRDTEAAVHALLLVLVLGSSDLPLQEAILRYALTALATMAASALAALRLGLTSPSWQGASGPVSALLALPVVLSLLQQRELSFSMGSVAVPAWVPFLVYGALQLSWILPRHHDQDRSLPRQRLFCSPWWWGLSFGSAWGVITWARLLLDAWMRLRPGS